MAVVAGLLVLFVLIGALACVSHEYHKINVGGDIL